MVADTYILGLCKSKHNEQTYNIKEPQKPAHNKLNVGCNSLQLETLPKFFHVSIPCFRLCTLFRFLRFRPPFGLSVLVKRVSVLRGGQFHFRTEPIAPPGVGKYNRMLYLLRRVVSLSTFRGSVRVGGVYPKADLKPTPNFRDSLGVQ